MFGKKYVVKLIEQKMTLFQTGVENLKLSNEMSGRFQVTMPTIVLAQLAFIGAIGSSGHISVLSAWAATVLIGGLVVFLVAISSQQIAILKGAKYHFDLAKKYEEYIESNKTAQVEYSKLPESLQIQTTFKYLKWPNRALPVSYGIIFIGSCLVMGVIWQLAQ